MTEERQRRRQSAAAEDAVTAAVRAVTKDLLARVNEAEALLDLGPERTTSRLRRRRGEGSIVQVSHKGVDGATADRWMGRVTIGPGKRRVVYGATQAECLRAMRTAQTKAEQGEPQGDARLTVETFLREWLEGPAQRTVRPSTFAAYRQYTETYLIAGLGRHRLVNLRPEHIDTMLAKLGAREPSPLSPRTLQQIRAILRSALSWGERNGRVPRNVAKLSEPPRAVRHQVPFLTAAGARDLVTAAMSDPWGALYVLALDTGLRQGELLGLRWTDVDLGAATLRVSQTRQAIRGKATFGEPKSQTSRRTVTFSATSQRLLTAHRARQNEQRLSRGRRWNDTGLVFTRETGAALDGPTVTHRFQRFLEAAGLPRMRFHDLRHASASLLLIEGQPARAVADRLGHSTTRLTQDTYAHLSPLQGEAARIMERIIGQA